MATKKTTTRLPSTKTHPTEQVAENNSVILSAKRLEKIHSMIDLTARAYAETGGVDGMESIGDDIFQQIGIEYRRAVGWFLWKRKLLRELQSNEWTKFPLSSEHACLAIRPQDFALGQPLSHAKELRVIRSSHAYVSYRKDGSSFLVYYATKVGAGSSTYIDDDLFGCEQRVEILTVKKQHLFRCGFCGCATPELYIDFVEYGLLMAFACVACQTWDSDSAMERYEKNREYVVADKKAGAA